MKPMKPKNKTFSQLVLTTELVLPDKGQPPYLHEVLNFISDQYHQGTLRKLNRRIEWISMVDIKGVSIFEGMPVSKYDGKHILYDGSYLVIVSFTCRAFMVFRFDIDKTGVITVKYKSKIYGTYY